MAIVSILYPHQRSMEEARSAADNFAGKLQNKLGVNCTWQGDTMQLERQGVNGALTLAPGEVCVELKLGMMLSPMKGQIESEIQRQLEKYLG
ncbi:MAG: polyhydroxyalkanoic acid system family protein [Gammaproteobacteria bacterium]|jgi:putative polyhydroxyalkanoate system protein|nr:polyhydroxyalkanoic acid system family protein [Gammaproteobacteria bacterium]